MEGPTPGPGAPNMKFGVETNRRLKDRTESGSRGLKRGHMLQVAAKIVFGVEVSKLRAIPVKLQKSNPSASGRRFWSRGNSKATIETPRAPEAIARPRGNPFALGQPRAPAWGTL